MGEDQGSGMHHTEENDTGGNDTRVDDRESAREWPPFYMSVDYEPGSARDIGITEKIAEYKRREADEVSETVDSVGWAGEEYEKSEKAPIVKYQERLTRCPEQCVRYEPS